MLAYGIQLEDLVGDDPFHAIFVREGIAFGILSRQGDGIRKIVHGVDLRPGEEPNIFMAGSEVYETWKVFLQSPQTMTYEQLTKSYDKLHITLAKKVN